MKDKRFLANIDKDAVCFAATIILFGVFAGFVGFDTGVAKETMSGMVEPKKDTIENCDGTCFDAKLPARTNTGDTLRVVGKSDVRKNVLVAAPLRGQAKEYKIRGAERVLPGDTIVFNPEHKFLMKNITQRNLEKQK